MAPRPIQLFSLPQEINDSVYVSGKYPLIIDSTGQASQFLKYRARYLSVFQKGDFEKESLRKAVVQALHNGAWLVLDFDKLECDLASHFDKECFPESVLSPLELFLEDTYTALLRAGDEFTAKVTYEHQEALAVGAFQDRTKAHAPERVADVNKTFEPKDAFRLIVCTKREEDLSAELLDNMCTLKVQVSEQEIKDNAGVWAGRERPKNSKSKEQIKLDNELLELAFDGETAEVKKLLEQGADPLAKEGRGHSSLSEAAVKGHLETVRCLLDWKPPTGSDPNAVGSDGRTALHKAAFGGFCEVVQLLLERGADPRIPDLSGDRPYDLACNDETRKVFDGWDEKATDKLKEDRQKAVDEEDIKNVKSEEERLLLERRKTMQRLVECVKGNDKDQLELELMDIEDRSQIANFRDDRGLNVLHLAADLDRLELAVLLLDEYGMPVNGREAKGWTPIAIAAFRGHKKVCKALMERKADPAIPNAYRKDAYDLAQDDEIRDALKACANGPQPVGGVAAAGGGGGGGGAGEAEEEAEGGKAKAKGKAKGKAKAAAGGSDASGAAGSGAAAAKALAKGKAKAKAKGKAK